MKRHIQPFMRRFLPSIPQSLTVFAFWLLMAQDVSPGNVVMALLLAWLMPLLAARLEREFARLGRLPRTRPPAGRRGVRRPARSLNTYPARV